MLHKRSRSAWLVPDALRSITIIASVPSPSHRSAGFRTHRWPGSLGWIPHPSLAGERIAERAARRGKQDELADRARTLSALLAAEWPGAAAALTLPASDPRLPWLVYAAEDLAAGLSHNGARAFVQAHAGHTKAREDLPRLLAAAGFEPDTLALLGVNRNPYVGLGGPILAQLSGRTLDFTGWPGPQDVRLPAGCPITVGVTAGTSALVIIENRQAAETICDQYPEVAVIWCHGPPTVYGILPRLWVAGQDSVPAATGPD